MKLSASFFPDFTFQPFSPSGISANGSSLTVTWKPFLTAVVPFAMTASNPGPKGFPSQISESGMKHNEDVYFFSRSNWLSVHAVPNAATVLS